MDRIFVSIAAYRDPQLVPTIEHALATAACPERLRFGICRQRDESDPPLPWKHDARFRLIEVDWRESRGACWARAEIMSRYDGETYYLQLDSHHRFAHGWDESLIRQLDLARGSRPLLTTYAPAFNPDDTRPLEGRPEDWPTQMNVDRFTDEGIVLFRPVELQGWRERRAPARARFVSAHFLFTTGDFVDAVPYDPDLYFIGEEITLAVRAYSHGFDLFHPNRVLVWHEYSREGRQKHWTDHTRENGIEVAWHSRDRASLERARRFLSDPWVGRFGLGTARTMAEYQAYAGIDFAKRRAQEFTREGLEPPNPPASPDWAERIVRYSLDVTLDRQLLPAGTAQRFWYFGVHDAGGHEIARHDVDAGEIATVLARPDSTLRLTRQFDTEREPASWTVWPYSDGQGWHGKLTGPIAVGPPPLTLVTAVLDIGRHRLHGSFGRAFEGHYLMLLERFLRIPVPMVLHVPRGCEPLVWRHRQPADTQAVIVETSDLERGRWFERVQEIRAGREWLAQSGWLASSPQAALPHYVPLVLSKMPWLAAVADRNPFATPSLAWMDVGLLNTVPASLLETSTFASGFSREAGPFMWLDYPCRDDSVGGMPVGAMARRAGVRQLTRRVQGSIFGGTPDGICRVARQYDAEVETTLRLGLMGTEESVFTILAARLNEPVRRMPVDADGSLTSFVLGLAAGAHAHDPAVRNVTSGPAQPSACSASAS